MSCLTCLPLFSSPKTTKAMGISLVEETDDNTGVIDISASEVKPTSKTVYDRIRERRPGNGKSGGGNILLLYLNQRSSLGATSIAY